MAGLTALSVIRWAGASSRDVGCVAERAAEFFEEREPHEPTDDRADEENRGTDQRHGGRDERSHDGVRAKAIVRETVGQKANVHDA
jgi:hypothetical protein